MNKNNVIAIAAILAVIFLAGPVSADQQVTLQSAEISGIGGTQTVTMVLDSAPAGLSGYIIHLTIADPAVAQFTAWQTPTWADIATLNTPVPASEIEVQAATFTITKVPNGSVNILLGTATIEGLSAGLTTINATLEYLDDNHEGDYIPTTTINPGTLTVVVAPEAQFTSDTTSGTAPLSVTFTDQSTGTITSRAWTFGDGGTNSTSNPSHTYSAPGTYTVNLTVTGPGGSDTESKMGYITVTETPVTPVAAFTADKTSGTAPLSVIFTDQSTGTITSRAWTFGDGGTSSSTNPSHEYTAAGTYTVNLTVTGPGGSDTESKVGYITANTPDPVNVTFSPQSRTFIPGESAEYQIMMDRAPQGLAGYDMVVSLANPGIAEFVSATYPPWVKLSHTPDLPNQSVLLSGVDIDKVINPGATNILLVTFSLNGTAAGTTPIVISNLNMDTDGGAIIPATPTNGEAIVYSTDLPVANFSVSVTNGVAPVGAAFTDMSTNSPNSWKWEYRNYDEVAWTEFGSGDQNPDHSFTTPGTYDIRLTATNAYGSNTVTKTHVLAAAHTEEPLTLDQSGTISGDLYVESPHTWATGVTEITHTFALPAYTGIEWAKLYINTYSGTAAGNYGLTSTVEFNGNTLGVETMDIKSTTTGASFPLNNHVTKVYSDYEAQYDVTSLITSTSPTVHVKGEAIDGLSFDGRIKGITLVVAYNDGDSDTVRYLVNHGHHWIPATTGSGSTSFDCSSLATGWTSAESSVRFHSSSDATYTFNSVPKASGSPTDVGGMLDTWNVTEELIQGTNILTFNKTTSGSYKATIGTLKVRYELSPTADFSADKTSGTAPLSVTFTDQSTGTITSRAWTFGDGNTSSLQNPTHEYTAAGTYTVNLTVTGPGGSDTESKTNYITVTTAPVPPVAAFTANTTSGTAPLSVTFTDQSTGTITSRAWTFGDGSTSSLQNPIHEYTAAGTYTVNLTVTGPGGSDTESKTNYITVTAAPVAPVAAFIANTTSGTAPLSVTFTDQSTNSPTSWKWEYRLGSGSWTEFSTIKNPSFVFSAPGTYDIRLTVANSAGSDDNTKTGFIKVNPQGPTLIADFTGAPTSGYSALVVRFTDKSIGNVTSWAWDFNNDGIIDSTQKNPRHIYTKPGIYTVRLSVSGPDGTDEEAKDDYISISQNRKPTVARFTSSPHAGSPPYTVQFSDQSFFNPTEYSWDFGDGSTSHEKNPEHTYTEPGLYVIRLKVMNEYGGSSAYGFAVVKGDWKFTQ